jgi:glycosyltransferase involved in cell wall biosynthesis
MNISHKTKILYLVTKGNWGGAQKYTYDMATALSPSEFDVVVVFGVPAKLKERLEEKNIRTITIPELDRDISFLKDATSLFTLIKLLKNERPDVVHLNSSKMGGLGALAARLTGVKRIIFTAHGWPFSEDRSVVAKKIIKFFSWLTVVLSHTTITLHEKDLHAFKYWPLVKGKIIKIYNGAFSDTGLSREDARNTLGRKLHIPPNVTLLGTIAELHRNKGLPYLIEALHKLPETVSLVILGEGEERKHLESLIRREHLDKRVYLAGFTPNASSLLKAFDVFVLSSIKEGVPSVLLEAGTARVPIVSTNVGGIPEIIESGKEGLLVHSKNTEELASALTTLLTDKQKADAYTTSFAKKIDEKFNFEKVTLLQTTALYKK